MRNIGLHLRITDTLLDIAHKALDLELSLFQCFFLHQQTNRFIRPTAQEKAAFLAVRDRFGELFVHASYWTNFASINEISLRFFKNELRLAKQLGFNHIIIHPGSAKGAQDRIEGIDAIARRLNYLLKTEHDIKVVLENTAHGNFSIGGDLSDLKAILEKIDHPEKISFCIDTAHAHVYGYPLAELEEQEQFFVKIEQAFGFERLALIHLNNTNQLLGSCLDRHTLLNEGILQEQALKAFISHEKMAHVPIILELPEVDEQVERDMLSMVRGWHTK